ncbi:MAG: hypothetical protein WBA42_23070 [Mesorhizobium sp.]
MQKAGGDNPMKMTGAGGSVKETLRRSGLPKTTAIDMGLFSTPLNRVVPGRYYQVRFKSERKWHRAFRWEKLWLASGDLVGRVENTAEVRPSKEEVMAAIDRVAERMMEPLDGDDTPGVKQHYIDRDLLDQCAELFGNGGADQRHPSRQQIAAYRAVRLAAAAKAMPSALHSEILVGYRVTDDDGITVFESLVLEEAIYYAQDNQGVCRQSVGVVFADGSVCFGHELSLRPWLKG